jgi:hypothetical protein
MKLKRESIQERQFYIAKSTNLSLCLRVFVCDFPVRVGNQLAMRLIPFFSSSSPKLISNPSRMLESLR